MRINTNVSALNTQRILGQTNAAAARQIGKLSSGFRINRAADDAAGLGIANKIRADLRAMGQASRNAEQANSLLQVAEGATQTVQSIVERMKELAAQSASDTVDSAGRTQINNEFGKLRDEITRIIDTTKFQGSHLLKTVSAAAATAGTATSAADATSGDYQVATKNFDITVDGGSATTITLDGDYSAGVSAMATDINAKLGAAGINTVTVSASANKLVWSHSATGSASTFSVTDTDSVLGGDVSAAGTDAVQASGGARDFLVSSSEDYAGQDLVNLAALDLSLANLGIDGANGDLSTAASARTTLANLDTSLTKLSETFGQIGAAQNRIEFATQNVKATIENYAAAESTIRDADMAAEMTEFSRQQILQQAGTAMLAQANQAAQGVLQLLR